MAALELCIALFAFWTAIGWALFALVPARVGPRQRALLSPTLGAAVVVVPVFGLNHLGMAVESFGTAVLAALGILAVAVIAWKRPAFPWRRMASFVAVLALALLLAAWPMLLYGFDWTSYNNSDMTHYSLGAARVLHGGFFSPPDAQAFLHGTDYSVYDAYKYIDFDARSGSELMLAAVWAATGLNAHLVFMPVVIALHLALIWAAAALAAGPRSPRNAALNVAFLMAISPLTTLGALYQLVAQVGGLAFLCASVALLYRAMPGRPIPRALAARIPVAVAMAGLFIWYPEILPFLGLGWFAFLAIEAWRDRRRLQRVLANALLAGVLLLVLLNAYFVGALKFMLSQAQGGGVNANLLQAGDIEISAFPYFLVPTGMPVFWGIIPLGGVGLDVDVLSATIFLAMVLWIWFLWGLPQSVRRGRPAAAVFIVMAVLALVLFRGNKDFGLFKLAMYAQPFVLALVGERFAAMRRGAMPTRIAFGVMGAALLAAILSQSVYVQLSTGEYLRGLSEIWHASALRINTKFAQVVVTLKEKSPAGYASDTASIVQVEHQTLHARGYPAFYPAAAGYGLNEASHYPQMAGQLPTNRKITLAGKETTFVLQKNLEQELARRWFVTIPRYDTIFNRPRPGSDPREYYEVAPPDGIADHLVFMPSQMGDHYYGFTAGAPTAFNHLEPDPIFPGRQMSGLGRDLLFMLVRPSPRPRVLMEITSTVMRHFDSRLPSPVVRGASRVEVPFMGDGSGRVVSAPVEPAHVEGVPFIAIDMGRAPQLTPHRPRGLMALYGRTINPDLRTLTTYGREISLLSEAQYAALVAPRELTVFPRDLGNPDLEYSGIYEDGWISADSFFVLGARAGDAAFRISGSVPAIADNGFRTTLRVSVDGVPAATRELGLGAFSVEVPLPRVAEGKRRVEIHFSRTQRLPDDDGRASAALVSHLGLVAGR